MAGTLQHHVTAPDSRTTQKKLDTMCRAFLFAKISAGKQSNPVRVKAMATADHCIKNPLQNSMPLNSYRNTAIRFSTFRTPG